VIEPDAVPTSDGPGSASWTRPTAAVVAVLTGVVCVAWSVLESWPGWWSTPHVVLLVLAAGLLGAGVALTAVIVVRRRRGASAGGAMALLIAAALLVVTAGLTVTHAPLRIRFTFDRDAFDSLADEARQLAADADLPPGTSFGVPQPQRSIGSYRGRVEYVEATSTPVSVSTPFSANGGWFVHVADDDAAGVAQNWAIDLGGGWYSSKHPWIPHD
jgi:hypothetical protein